jgi:hypothetical protein
MWRPIVFAIWEHIVGTTIKDGFFNGSFDDASNKNNFFNLL